MKKKDCKCQKISRFLVNIKCKLGLHDWILDSENIESTLDKGTLVIIWWNCKHCWETKLKCLLR